MSEECCGGSGATPTTSCRIDLPATSPVTRHCVAVSGSCAQANQSCSVDADCCGSTPCIGGQCIAAPTYTPATFTRDYQVTCPQDGYKIVWGDLRWHASALSNSSLSFSAQTSADGNFATATSVPVATVTSANSNAPPAAVLTADVGAKLLAAQIGPRNYLRLTMSFTPSADSLVSPILYDWEQRYTCVPAE